MYTVEKVAELLNLKPTTIRTWLKEGKLNGTKIGKSWRISADELKRLFPEDKFFVMFRPATEHSPSDFNLNPEMEKNKELAKELYPEEYEKNYWRESAIEPWDDFASKLKEEIPKAYPYPFKPDEIAYYNNDKTDYLEGGTLEAWQIYYSLKLKDEQKRFESMLANLKEKYNMPDEEITEIKKLSYGIHLLRCAQPLYDDIG